MGALYKNKWKILIGVLLLGVVGSAGGLFLSFGPPDLMAKTETPLFCASCHTMESNYRGLVSMWALIAPSSVSTVTCPTKTGASITSGNQSMACGTLPCFIPAGCRKGSIFPDVSRGSCSPTASAAMKPVSQRLTRSGSAGPATAGFSITSRAVRMTR